MIILHFSCDLTYQRDGSHPFTLQGAVKYMLAAQEMVSFATGAIFSGTETDTVLWAKLLTETTETSLFLHQCSISKFSCQIFALGS